VTFVPNIASGVSGISTTFLSPASITSIDGHFNVSLLNSSIQQNPSDGTLHISLSKGEFELLYSQLISFASFSSLSFNYGQGSRISMSYYCLISNIDSLFLIRNLMQFHQILIQTIVTLNVEASTKTTLTFMYYVEYSVSFLTFQVSLKFILFLSTLPLKNYHRLTGRERLWNQWKILCLD